MLDTFINSALIIDDSAAEVTDLQNFLEQRDIWVKHYTPANLDQMHGPFKNRKIIFLDLQLDDADSTINNIARIRRYLREFVGLQFGSYGIVLWTKHADEVSAVRNRIALDQAHYAPPLFIVGLDKTKYLTAGNYNGVLDDLEAELRKNIASRFFVEWNILVDKAKDSTISNIFQIVPDYERQEQNLQFILYKIAKNYTGIPQDQIPGHNLTKDTIKGFSDMLHYEVVDHATQDNFLFNNGNEFFYRLDIDSQNQCEYSSSNFLYGPLDKKALKKNGTAMQGNDIRIAPGKDIAEVTENKVIEICSQINSRLLIDSHNLNQALVLPGNIYQIIGNSPLKLEAADLPVNATNIAIEVTPPCDFANSKKGNMSRIISGFMCDYTSLIYSNLKGDKYYKDIWPIVINNNQPKLMVFDFRYFGAINEAELRNAANYQLILKAKDRLFADILQKLSSYTARLGLSVIH